ncbi:MAG: hypothetical protein JW908_00740 [Anaerolineales bacterium]|nr:hypothetical protein [Anaerolineales bacterium]
MSGMRINPQHEANIEDLCNQVRAGYRPGEYEEHFIPTGESNLRKACCKRCGKTLAKGEACQWLHIPENENYSPSSLDIFYYCPECHRYNLAFLEIKPRLAAAGRIIWRWCLKWGSSLFLYQRIDRLINSTDLSAADAAETLINRLPEIEGGSDFEIEKFVERVIAEAEESVEYWFFESIKASDIQWQEIAG